MSVSCVGMYISACPTISKFDQEPDQSEPVSIPCVVLLKPVTSFGAYPEVMCLHPWVSQRACSIVLNLPVTGIGEQRSTIVTEVASNSAGQYLSYVMIKICMLVAYAGLTDMIVTENIGLKQNILSVTNSPFSKLALPSSSSVSWVFWVLGQITLFLAIKVFPKTLASFFTGNRVLGWGQVLQDLV